MKVTDANGTTGFILWDGTEYCFRVYYNKHNFVDYRILHHDLEVMITGEDASFYVDESREQGYLDYSPHILGESA